MLEAQVEAKLKSALEQFGFKVLKLRTPGYSNVMDRIILMPVWSPGPPAFVELKAPKKHLRAAQAATGAEWLARGCQVRKMCDTVELAQGLADHLLCEAVWRLGFGWLSPNSNISPRIREAYKEALFKINGGV